MAKEVIMPKFGFTQEEAEIIAIFKHNGDTVRNGDPLMEVTTDKVNMEVEATGSGILAGLDLKVGDVVPVATVIAYILTAKEAAAGVLPKTGAAATAETEASKVAAPAAESVATSTREATPVAARLMAEAGIASTAITGTGPQGRITRQDVEAYLAKPTTAPTADGKVRASPNARRLARERGVALHEVAGTGPDGRVQGWDVLTVDAVARKAEEVPAVAPVEAEATPVAPPTTERTAAYTEIPFTSMRRAIARNLTKSYQEAPHIFFQRDMDMGALQAVLERLRQRPSPAKLSMTILLAKVVAWALAQHPRLNSHLDGETIRQYHDVNMGIAVALDEGLIVPVLRNVGGKGMGQLAGEWSELSQRARKSQLKAPDLAEGTFTISNLGMFGMDRFTAIINPPQVGILAVGATTQRFVPDAHGQPVLRSICTFTLSVDHRVIDGAVAAQFMATLAEGLTEPTLLLM